MFVSGPRTEALAPIKLNNSAWRWQIDESVRRAAHSVTPHFERNAT